MKTAPLADQPKLYSANLIEQVNPNHPLLRTAGHLDWNGLDTMLGSEFAPGKGRPALRTRVMIGLNLIKYIYDLSDAQVCERFVENPYWQAFCGFQEFQYQAPCDPSSLTRWRQRMGDGLEALLKETLAAAQRAKALKPDALHEVIVDTTVQEKAVAHPSDARLLYKMQLRLVREARRRGIPLPRTWLKAAKRALIRHGRYRHAKLHKKAAKQLCKLRTFVGRVQRALARGAGAAKVAQPALPLAEKAEPPAWLARETTLARKVIAQSRGQVPSDERIYALHAPEVECIAKGKARKPYEFGCKVALAATSAKHPFLVAAGAVHGNPYDGATLKRTLAQAERTTGMRPSLCGADKGYRGKRHHPEGTGVLIAGTRKLGGKMKRFMRRRNAIEPVIGHAKSHHRLDRHHLRGEAGDRANALLSACAWNFRQIWRHLVRKARRLLRLLSRCLGLFNPRPAAQEPLPTPWRPAIDRKMAAPAFYALPAAA